MPKGRVLITDDVHMLLIQGLEQAGYQCDYQPHISHEQVLDCVDGYDGLIINSKILVHKPLLDKALRLKFVGRLGSGLEIIDLAYAAAKGVAVYSSPAGNCDAVAEHALGMLLMLANKLGQADKEVKAMQWHREANRGWELMGKTIGIIGCGHTGSALAKRLAGWGMRVLAYDKYKQNYTEHLPHVQESNMEQLYATCDIVSLHLPLTPETKGCVDAAFLQRFQRPIVLVNTSRGQVVKTADMLAALQNNTLKGACLDVFENEKPETYTPDEKNMYAALMRCQTLVVSPHIAGWTKESKERLAQIILDKILNLN